MENRNFETAELDAMRQQLNLLKTQLDKQEIVNDRLLRQAMRQRMSWIERYVWVQLLLTPVLIVAMGFVFVGLFGLSWWLFAAMALIVASSAISDFVVNRTKRGDWLAADLSATAVKLGRMKLIRKRQVQLEISLMIITIIWMCIELYFSEVLPIELRIATIISVLVGMVVGGGIGLSILYKMQRTNDELIAQINDGKEA